MQLAAGKHVLSGLAGCWGDTGGWQAIMDDQKPFHEARHRECRCPLTEFWSGLMRRAARLAVHVSCEGAVLRQKTGGAWTALVLPVGQYCGHPIRVEQSRAVQFKLRLAWSAAREALRLLCLHSLVNNGIKVPLHLFLSGCRTWSAKSLAKPFGIQKPGFYVAVKWDPDE